MTLIHIVILSILIKYSCLNAVQFTNNSHRNFIFNTYTYDTHINLVINDTAEQILDFYEDTDKFRGYPTRVHVSSNDTIDGEYPIFVTATQQKGVSSWELPLVVQTPHSVMQYDNMARTLCPHDAGPNITSENRPLIQITTSSPKNVSVDIKLRRVEDFYVEVNKVVALNVTPSTPKYYYFSFDNNPPNHTAQEKSGLLPRFNYTIPKSVMVIIESDDDVCAVVSIQNNSCPVFDNERDMVYQGYRLTMTRRGGITLTQSMFPVGFYIVLIVKQQDEECTGVPGYLDQWREKNIRFHIIPTISFKEYLIAAASTVALVFVVSLSALLVYIPSCGRCYEEVVVEQTAETTSSRVLPSGDEEQLIVQDEENDQSDSDPDWASPMPTALTLAGLSRARPTHHLRRSNRYFWSALTVAVVYALPVVQLLSTYQHMVFQTGDQDLCYYNSLCSHPYGPLADSNHVFSNVGYVILGAVFAAQARARQTRRVGQNLGIPSHPGLFYSMGLALAMEGLLSACYHLCPNKMNFQFDSSFMYVISALGMVKLYQNRHPDVNANAHSTFMVLAAVMALGVYGIMYANVYFWVFFTMVHLATCFVLTLKIYYVGRFSLDTGLPRRAYTALSTRGRRALVPAYCARAVLLALANAANWALAGYGLYEHNKDFARHLLAILMGNTIIYTLFYIAMKIVYKERIYVHTWLYIILAHVAWFIASRFFLDSNTKWSETPAHSRRHNRECTALQFYDSHDLWHLASAAALYFSFNILLTIDDALVNTDRSKIPVF